MTDRLQVLATYGDMLPIASAPSSKACAAAGLQQPPLVGAGADNREGPKVPCSSETRSSLSADSGESGNSQPATAFLSPGAAASPAPSAAEAGQ